MDNKQNKYISVSYQLFTIDGDGKKELVEETQQGQPFQFITGFGFSLDSFETHIAALDKDQTFDFTLTPAEAFGEYYEEGVRKLGREFFEVNGKFDSTNIYPGAVITLRGEDEQHFMAHVTKVEDDGVTLDTNHPLAGQTLQFKGTVLENRDATAEEIQNLLTRMSHECGGCGGHCGGDCGGDCEGDHDHEDGCCGGGCGHCHH
jgi:FKBP-type peptidyl-prolyl cis-trans isomerase SlyD